MRKRFVVIVTPAKVQRYRIFDRLTKKTYSASDDLNRLVDLANQYNETYQVTLLARLSAWLLRRALPEPTPDPVDAPVASEPEAIPEWKQKLVAINALCEKRKREMQLANGGRIVESDSIN